MQKLIRKPWFIIIMTFPLYGCAIKSPITHQYKLEAFSNKHVSAKSRLSILITLPEAVSGYQSEKMLYIKKPFELSTYAHNSWVGTPANMIFPLILQSLRSSGYFYAVTSTPYSDRTDYRVDTQLLRLHQNFLTNPSTIDFSMNVVLTKGKTNKIIASKIITQKIPCPEESPFGGVLAANRAICNFTSTLTDFIITNTKDDVNKSG